jgi:hypothetical protein
MSSITKILIGLGVILVFAGIVAISLYNYQLLQAIQPDAATQTTAPAKTQVISAQAAGTAARPVVIDPNNDPLAPVKHAPIAPSPQNGPAEDGKTVFSKTYETPLKSPVLVQ